MKVIRAALLLLAVAIPAFAEPERAAAGGHPQSWLQAAAPYINFAILVGILVYLLRKPMKDFLMQKREAITKMLGEAQAAREEARRRMSELQMRMESLQGDIDLIRTNAEREAAAEKERLLEEARAEAQRIVEAAQMEVDGKVRLAVRDLRAYLVTEAVARAEDVIRGKLRDESHEKLIDEYVGRLSKN